MKKLAILNAQLFSTHAQKSQTGSIQKCDLMIENGKIQAFGQELFSDGLDQTCPRIHANGNYVLPGAIDLHVKAHTSLKTLEKRAARSGITSIVIIPTQRYPLDKIESLHHFYDEAKDLDINFYPSLAMSKNLKGEAFSEIGLLAKKGAVFLTQGDQPIKNSSLFLRICQYNNVFNLPVFHRALDPDLSEQDRVYASQYTDMLGLIGQHPLAEPLGIIRDSYIAQSTKTHLIHDRVCTKNGIQEIQYCQRLNASKIEASCAVYNLFFNHLDIDHHNIQAKTCPPLCEEEDRKALLSAINDQTIHYVVSGDSSPLYPEIHPFSEMPYSTKSMEYLWPVGITLAKENQLLFEHYVHAISQSPANLLGLLQGKIAKGHPADLVMINPEKTLFMQKSRYSILSTLSGRFSLDNDC